MGCNNGKQHGEQGNQNNNNNNKRSTIKKVLRFQKRRTSNTSRPLSFTESTSPHEGFDIPIRPVSMFVNLELKTLTNGLNQPINDPNNLSRSTSTESIRTELSHNDQRSLTIHSQQTCEIEINLSIITNTQETPAEVFDENNWKYYIPLTFEKVSTISLLKDLVYSRVNNELLHILNRLKSDESEDFVEWFFDELEYFMSAYDDDCNYQHKPLLIRSIEQERYDCSKYLLDHQLAPSKLDINLSNDQGRHCLLMLAHKNGPIDMIEYLLTRHISCLDTNKLDLNTFHSLHHACRNFNLSISELLLSYTNRKSLQIENSELHTPLDYWIECLCSLKKLKPTNIQHHSDSLRLDYLLNNVDYHSNVSFFQTLINHGGQLTKIPLRYIRSILPQLTFEQKLAYVDHHVNLCCTLYKNRLSTLLHDYDNFKISIQAGEILTEFIYALGTVQLEIQSRLAAHAFSNVCDTEDKLMKMKEHEGLQSTMRLLYFKFFRLFQCVYNNPDVNVKNFHFEHIFRRVWVYWKEPVRAFIAQCKQKNSSLKSICRIVLFKRLTHYPADIQYLPINPALKEFVSFDNQFFVIRRKY